MVSGKGSSLKDELFNREKVRYLGGLFRDADPAFDADGFEATVMKTMLELELKARMDLISIVLAEFLHNDFAQAAAHIHKALPEPLDPNKTDNDFGAFIFGALGEYVGRNGLDDLPVALALLREITKRSSMEFAIRHFLNAAPEPTMQALAGWIDDDHYHVRRLVSEGTRPKLPWGVKVGIDVNDPIPFLDALHFDNTRFVTRSVANHLNDISKIDPTLVLDTLKSWHKAAKQDQDELDWMTRHALRTLVKKGDLAALELLGYHAKPDIEVSLVSVSHSNLPIGDVATFDVTITANRDENLMVDYVIDFVKANGSSKPRVFKWRKLALKKGESITLQKNHRFLKDSSTFTHYAGPHHMHLQINGARSGSCDFTLT